MSDLASLIAFPKTNQRPDPAGAQADQAYPQVPLERLMAQLQKLMCRWT